MNKKCKIWTKGLLFFLLLPGLQITPKAVEAGDLPDLYRVDVLNFPYGGVFLDSDNQILFFDKYLKDNMLVFPTYKQNYEQVVKKNIYKNKTRVKIILWTIEGVVLGASLGMISGIFVEKYY